jgi:PAS domain S-box-containing protein
VPTVRERQRANLVAAVSRALSATVGLTLLGVAVGALAGVPFLLRMTLAGTAITPTQALGLAAGLGSLEAWRRGGGRPTRLHQALAGLTVLCGVAELAGLAGWRVVGPEDLDDTATLLLLGAGLACLGGRTPVRRAGEAALVAAAALGLATLVAHAYGTRTLVPSLDVEPMALPLAYGMVALPAAALLAQAEQGFFGVLLGDGLGGRLARTLLPLGLGLPIALGAVLLHFERAGVIDAAFGVTIGAIVTALATAGLMAWGAQATGRDERTLREEEDRWRLLTDTVSEPIATVDAQGRIEVANRAMELLFERSRAELAGTPMQDLVAPAHWETLRGLLHPDASGQSVQMAALRRDGHEFPVEAAVAMWRGREGERYTLMLHDATRRQMVEQALRGARQAAEAAARAKADFLANMSHEIRTPMNAVIGMTQLLGDTPLTAEQEDYAKTIRASGEHLMTIINDILDYSKIEAGKVELEQSPVDLRGCVEECLGIVARRAAEKGLETGTIFSDAVPEAILGDPARLRQVLLNLLSNAVKFTAKGEVVVHVDAKPLGGGRHEVHVAVADTGIGIPPDRFDRLFKSFSQVDSSTTRTYGGTGLGLAISKRLVELMGGRIWAESREGQGSTFNFTITAEQTAMPEAPRRRPADAPSLQGRRVLVVDDNATNRRILRAQLGKWGLVAEEATNGQEALDRLAAAPFDVALVDHQMPGMDGVTLCERAHQAHPRLALLVVSSVGGKPEGWDRPGLGISAFLTKPVRASDLLDSILSALGERPSPAPAAPPPVVSATPPSSRRGLRVLLAEDNVVNQKVALKMLERLGVAADVANNGEEAVAALQAKPYDVVFMDVQMPRMDGLEATRRIRGLALPQRPVIVAMTAHAMPGDRERCLEAGMDDYITKPVRLEALDGVLGKLGVPA